MSYFLDQHQIQARTRWTVLLYVAAVAALLLAVNALVGFIAVNAEAGTRAPVVWPDTGWIIDHGLLLSATTAILLVGIAGSALYRTSKLAQGGAVVARTLGGALVAPDVVDPPRRQLRSVIEEISIASGIPVPEVYVLECEPGINALAAGHTHSDMALVVTRGCIEYLDRAELQAVIAHEFVHILNGDARRNLRLTGALFGIMIISLAGLQILRLARREGGKGRARGPLMLLGALLYAVGAVGYLPARLIQARVTRDRELRVDAAAAQFTRAPHELAGALYKVAALKAGSILVEVDPTEYAHMLFAASHGGGFLTHPSFAERINLLDPPFDPSRVDRLNGMLATPGGRAQSKTPPLGVARHRLPSVGDIARPSRGHVAFAEEVLKSIPAELNDAAHSIHAAIDAILALLIDEREPLATDQLGMIAKALGHEHADRVQSLLTSVNALDPSLRLPLVELSFPALKRRPRAELRTYGELINQLTAADGEITVFEFALSRMIGGYLREAVSSQPQQTASVHLRHLRDSVRQVFSVLACVGNPDATAREQAFAAGMRLVYAEQPVTFNDPGKAWVDATSAALERLDQLRMRDKERLIAGLINVLVDDETITLEEVELLRAICASLHCPMPPRIEIVPDSWS